MAQASRVDEGPPSTPTTGSTTSLQLESTLERAARYLPTQGPLQTFIFQNTLQAFEDIPFDRAVESARQILGGEPYLREDEYRKAIASGRITRDDLHAVLRSRSDLDGGRSLVRGAVTRGRLRDLLLRHGLVEISGAGRQWHIEEVGWGRRLLENVPPEARSRIMTRTLTWLRGLVERGDMATLGEALVAEPSPGLAAVRLEAVAGIRFDLVALTDRLHQDPEPLVASALWSAARLATRRALEGDPRSRPSPWQGRRHRDLLLGLSGLDTDDLVHPHLIRWTAVYLDQGIAHWPIEDRSSGLLAAVAGILRSSPPSPEPWLEVFRSRFLGCLERGQDAASMAVDCLEELGVGDDELEVYLRQTLLALKGWAGMVYALERNPTLAPFQRPPIRLLEFLAIRLALEAAALEAKAGEEFEAPPRLANLRQECARRGATPADDPDDRALAVLQVAELAGISAPELMALSPPETRALLDELDAFGSLERRRILHSAYERHYHRQILDALAANRRIRAPDRPATPPRLQIVTCIDDRFEGLRRHIEDVSHQTETLGAAGFFGVAIWFRGLDDLSLSPLCPLGNLPAHTVIERVRSGVPRDRGKRRGAWRLLALASFLESRYLVLGWVSTALLGLLSAFPLVFAVLFPRLASRLRSGLRERLLPRLPTDLTVDPAGEELGRPLGLGVPDMVERVAGLLLSIGLDRAIAPVVVVLGHESSSVNNPHFSAYQCGACGGRSGAPNARLFALMANRPDVRQALEERGIRIPAGTWFVGGVYDTCSDRYSFFDQDRIPESHRGLVEEAGRTLDEARARHAQERCRRFNTAPDEAGPEEALAHVEARSVDLAQPWPENDHGGNACCVVGRRGLTRGVFLDRRAFLVSYDPGSDPEGTRLGSVLSAILPVVSGINLAYYFGRVDNEVYGSGTKLPHSLSALLGVVNGHQGDLRPGAWWQTVQIHEPVRLLMVIETTPGRLRSVMERSTALRRAVENRWILVATQDPETGEIRTFEETGFEPYVPDPDPLPIVSSWRSWFVRRNGSLPPALLPAEVLP